MRRNKVVRTIEPKEYAELNLESYHRDILRTIDLFVCDTIKGRASFSKQSATVPLWAEQRGKDYFLYYIAHELSHIFAFVDSYTYKHDEIFYLYFKDICPVEYQHYEYGYKPQVAEAYGVSRHQG